WRWCSPVAATFASSRTGQYVRVKASAAGSQVSVRAERPVPRNTMEKLLALEMVRVTEAAAIAAARYKGRGDRHEADQDATEAMRRTMDDLDIAATIVIG